MKMMLLKLVITALAIGLAIRGLLCLILGKYRSKKVVIRGWPARKIGVFFLLPITLHFLIFRAFFEGRFDALIGSGFHFTSLLLIIFIIAAIVAAAEVRSRATEPGKK